MELGWRIFLGALREAFPSISYVQLLVHFFLFILLFLQDDDGGVTGCYESSLVGVNPFL